MLKSGKQWPIFVAVAILGVVGLSYWTIKETMKTDLTQSDMYMSKYQYIDENINDYLMKKIEFKKHYDISLSKIDISKEKGFVQFHITDKSQKSVDDAQMELIFTRPISDAKDIKLKPSSIKNGVYSFEGIDLPKKGRWNILLHVKIGQFELFDNLKTDTRTNEVYSVEEAKKLKEASSY